MKYTKKIIVVFFLAMALVSMTKADETRDAAQALREKKIISQSPEKIVYEQVIQRREAAVIMKRYAVSEWKALDQKCSLWSDTTKLVEKNELLEACKIWLFKQAAKFNPYQNFTRGQLIMVLARFLNNNPTMELDAAYDDLLARKIITVDDRTMSTRNAMRSEVYLMLYRLKKTPSSHVFQQIVKLYSYQTDSVFGTISVVGYGSAVLIEKNKILTNAHVVLDEDGNPLKHFEYCVSESFTKKPICGLVAKLLYYDTEIDLALLQIEGDMPWSNPVQLSSTSQFSIGDKITVYWYPANGGGTITLTQWVIGGFEDPFYKIDANLDGGNSGWWGFDSEGKLVGIPTFVSEWYSTLGYMVPVNKIRDFLDKKGVIKEILLPVNSLFKQYVAKVAERVKQNTIVHDELVWKIAQWFEISDIQASQTETTTNSYPERYDLVSKNKNTTISIGITTVNKDRNSAKVRENLIASAKKTYLQVSTGEFATGNTVWYTVTWRWSDRDKKSMRLYYFEKTPGKTMFFVEIMWSTDYMTDRENAKKTVESISRKKNFSTDDQVNKVLWPITIQDFQWFSSELIFNNAWLGLQLTLDEKTSGIIEIVDHSYSVEESNYSRKDYADAIEKQLEYYEEKQLNIVKNSKWVIWLMIKIEEDGKTSYSFSNISKAPNDSKWRITQVRFNWDSSNEEKILKFVDGISINGSMLFNLDVTPIPLK